MNPKHDEWFAIERGAELRREVASSHLLARAGDTATERHRRVFVSGSTKSLLQALLALLALLALPGFRPTPNLEPPTTPRP